METSILKKFTMFAFNYPPLFCLKIWGDQSPHLANHFNDKFNDCHSRFGATGAMISFYNGLDATNAKIFENYLMNEYDAE